MTEIRNVKLLYLKAAMFVVLGIGGSALLLVEHPTLQTAFLLVISVWAFCRAYYFAFYVIQHYVDSSYRFAGLWSFARYSISRLTSRKP